MILSTKKYNEILNDIPKLTFDQKIVSLDTFYSQKNYIEFFQGFFDDYQKYFKKDFDDALNKLYNNFKTLNKKYYILSNEEINFKNMSANEKINIIYNVRPHIVKENDAKNSVFYYDFLEDFKMVIDVNIYKENISKLLLIKTKQKYKNTKI